jgi:hypothetical protein
MGSAMKSTTYCVDFLSGLPGKECHYQELVRSSSLANARKRAKRQFEYSAEYLKDGVTLAEPLDPRRLSERREAGNFTRFFPCKILSVKVHKG